MRNLALANVFNKGRNNLEEALQKKKNEINNPQSQKFLSRWEERMAELALNLFAEV